MAANDLIANLSSCGAMPTREQMWQQYDGVYKLLLANQGKAINPNTFEGRQFVGAVAYAWSMQQVFGDMGLLTGDHRRYVNDINGWYAHFFGMAGGAKTKHSKKKGGAKPASSTQKAAAHMITLALGGAALFGTQAYVMPIVFRYAEQYALTKGSLMAPCSTALDYGMSITGISRSCASVEAHNKMVIDSILNFGPLGQAFKNFAQYRSYGACYEFILNNVIVPIGEKLGGGSQKTCPAPNTPAENEEKAKSTAEGEKIAVEAAKKADEGAEESSEESDSGEDADEAEKRSARRSVTAAAKKGGRKGKKSRSGTKKRTARRGGRKAAKKSGKKGGRSLKNRKRSRRAH